MRTTDPFEHDAAAHVLGALSEPDLEAHQRTCEACMARVNLLTETRTLLADITVGDLTEPEPEPDTPLPGLLHRAASARRPVLIGRVAAGVTPDRSLSARKVP